jgi:bifunctional non-homologous end joining protein LigD
MARIGAAKPRVGRAPSARAGKVLQNKAPLPDFVPPQLATRVEGPPSESGWLHEIKFDGYRIQARIEYGPGRRAEVRMLTRRGLDWTDRFLSVAKACGQLPVRQAVVDGEIVAFEPDGNSNFSLLQHRLSEGADHELVFVVFDLLHLDGRDLRPRPLEERKALLRPLVEGVAQLRFSEHFDQNGEEVYRRACELRLEGMISKRAVDPYLSGRSLSWLKSKCRERQELVIGGFTDSTADFRGLGSLLLGYWDKDRFHYAGRVGTGFTDRSSRELRDRLNKLVVPRSPFAALPTAARRGAHFVKPELVGEVELASWTRDGMVRQASFLGLREDKPARSIGRERVMPVPTDVGER